MYTCPRCRRPFERPNQSHFCVVKDVGELLLNSPDEHVLAWDKLNEAVLRWEPNHCGASVKSIVYTSKRVWMVIKPMKQWLDVKFYHSERLEHDRIKRHSGYRSKTGHHLRIRSEADVDEEVLAWLRASWDDSVKTSKTA